jgi:signal transduction histidine kinase
MRQNAAYFEKAFLEGDVFETQRIMWRITNENIKRIIFHPVEFKDSKWIFKEEIVGNIYERPYFQIKRSVPFISNGVELGTLDYVIDIIDINSFVLSQNYALFITITIFFIGLLLLSNIGAIKTILSIEKSVNEINKLMESGEYSEIEGSIERSLKAMPQNLKDTPFADLVNKVSEVLQKTSKLEIELAISKTISDLSAQVAHDIRSPLAALDSSLNDISQLPEEKRIIIRNAINRIRDIANNLLEKYRYNSNEKFDFDNNQTKNLKTCLISTLIDQVITEKRLQYKTKPEINIDFELTNNSYGLFSNIDPVEFKRIISNLVNNSVEAIPYDKGNIKVILSSEDEYVIVKVKDDGRGIPPEILSRLGEKGLTFNKKGGSGLGLYHSKTTLERWSGKLEINSELNKGTEIIIKIPKAKTPDWFCESINIDSKTKIIIVDDDETIHNIWEDRFKKYNIEIIHLYNPNDLKHYTKTEKELYLIDYEFKGYNESGLDLIKELNISDKSILVSSHFESEIIIERCRKLNIKLIPKTLSGFVPVIFTEDENKVKEVVLIDDDELVLMNWQISAKKKGIKLIKYKNSKDFYKDIDKIDKETPIYIDSELEEGQKGEDIAKDLREKGFKKIILETGHQSERFKDISWLKIVGKEPPF